MDVERVHRALIEYIVKQGVGIEVRLPESVPVLGVSYTHETDVGPTIYIIREKGDEVAVRQDAAKNFDIPDSLLQTADPVLQICELAHEYGHHEPWSDGAYGRKNERIAKNSRAARHGKALMPMHKNEIVADEAAAWTVARRVLREVGFDVWERYNVIRNEKLDSYKAIKTTR